MDTGPTVVEDGADELVDVKFVEALVGLVDDEIGLCDQELDHVDGQEPNHTDSDGLVRELIEE